MPNIRSYEDWISRTKVKFKKRSSALKKVDQQVKKYFAGGGKNKIAEADLLRKLKEWMSSKGAGNAWKTSARNNNKAVEDLFAQVNFGPIDQTQYLGDVAHTRKGVLYLWSNLAVKDPMFERIISGGLNIASNSFAVKAEVLNSAGNAAGSSTAAMRSTATAQATVAVPNLDRGHGASEKKGKIRRVLENFVQSLKDDKVTIAASVFKSVIRTLADIFWASAAHLIKGSLDAISGLAKACKGASNAIKSWWRSRGVLIQSGHPSVICGSLRRAMKFDVVKGLARVVQSAASMALTSLGAVGGAIFNLVVSIIEFLGNLVIRYKEVKNIRDFINDCKRKYAFADSPRSIINNPNGFQEWYSCYVKKHPIIAAITLNSGICGDKMHFLNVFQKDGYAITQDEFNQGVKYVDGLKSYASDQIGNWGFRFSSSASGNDGKMINGLLRLAGTFNNPGKIFRILTA